MNETASVRRARLLRREVVEVCAFIFVADVVTGIQAPTFPLYAVSLGATVGLLGILTAVYGITRLLAALPVGGLSDQIGRKAVLIAGMLLFGFGLLAITVVPSPGWLAIGRVLYGLGNVATFPLGAAYITDVVPAEDRIRSVGLYTTAMGAGFAVGPLIGAWTTVHWGYIAAYRIGFALALGASLFAFFRLRHMPSVAVGRYEWLRPSFGKWFALLRQKGIAVACLGNFLLSIAVSGAMLTYFPIYAHQAGIGTVIIGVMFAVRAATSAAGRLPASRLFGRLPGREIILTTLALEMVAYTAISLTTSTWFLLPLLAFEGISYGTFIMASQMVGTEEAGSGNRGLVISLVWMSGGLGDTCGSLLLALVATTFGTVAVFRVVAILIALALAGVMSRQWFRREPSQQSSASVPAGGEPR
jgi:MFS family permease